MRLNDLDLCDMVALQTQPKHYIFAKRKKSESLSLLIVMSGVGHFATTSFFFFLFNVLRGFLEETNGAKYATVQKKGDREGKNEVEKLK